MATREQLAYLAGLMDGEGSITIRRARDHPKAGHLHYQLQIHVAMQDREALRRFQRVFPAKIGVNAGFTWRISWSGTKAGAVLNGLVPWMVTKRRQARIGLGFQACRKQRAKRDPYTTEEIARDARFRRIMLRLNHHHAILVRKSLRQQIPS